MTEATVIYHSADFDGIFCREIARKFLPNASLIGWDYGRPTPDIDGTKQLYMLDISLPDLMDHPNLIWIDHHKSAIEKFPSTIPGYRIDGVAACRLAWQWFTTVDGNTPRSGTDIGIPIRPAGILPMIQDFKNREVNEPFAVCLAGEYDIWDKHDPRAELFQHGLRSEELNWELLLQNDPPDGLNPYLHHLLDQGRALQYARTHENESIINELGFTLRWEGMTFLACNAARYNSHLFTAGLQPEHDACYGFKWTGKDWSVSLYHAPGKEHHDLSTIAVKHGGGGHRGACGFKAIKLPFLYD